MDAREATRLFKESKELYGNARYTEAMQILHRLDLAYPNAKNILFPMALCLEKLNHTGEALLICDRLIAQFDMPRAREMKARLENPAGTMSPLFPDGGANLLDDPLGLAPRKKAPAAPPARETSKWMWFAAVGAVALVVLVAIPVVLGRLGGGTASPSSPAETTGGAGGLLAVLLLVGFGIYLFMCYCLKLICEKAGQDPGILIWIPLLQVIPLFKAADLSLAWLLLGFVPIANILVPIMLWMKLCEARDKPSWLGILVIVPGIGIIVVLYLAFSD